MYFHSETTSSAQIVPTGHDPSTQSAAMPQPKFQLYKHIKISGKWRYCRAAIYSNGKVKPHVVSWSVDRKRSTKKALVRTCKKACVEDVSKQDMIDFLGWLRKQPLSKRTNSNPERTYSNKVGYVAIFLREFGVSRLLKKKEYPRYHKKKVVAHPEDELSPDAEERFLMDFLIGSMGRDHEAYGSRYSDLTGVTLTIRGKQYKTRTVEISPRLAANIVDRGSRSESVYLFPNRKGKPDLHLLRDVQSLAKRAGAKFHTELHKLRKTGASRRYLKGAPLMTLMQELRHESLATTQDYLADVRREDEAKKAAADADFVPKPHLVSGRRLEREYLHTIVVPTITREPITSGLPIITGQYSESHP